MLRLDKHIRIDKETIESANLTARWEDSDLGRIGNHIWEGYDRDERSRAAWLHRNEAGMNLAMQIATEKSFPWANSSNVAFPLVTIAALQFHSRSYPAIISGTDVVRCRTTGVQPTEEDCQRAYRVSRYMSYQVLEEDPGWEEGHDRLLINVPIVGCAFMKTRFSAEKGHNASDLVLAKDLVIDYYAKSLEGAHRITQKITKYRNDIYTSVKMGVYRDVLEEAWYKEGGRPELDSSSVTPQSDTRSGVHQPMSDAETPFTFLEQHCWMDLDDDGYAEPYVALIEEQSRCLVRLTLRCDTEMDVVRDDKKAIMFIRPLEAFTKYELIPSPDGGVYGMGFGTLLGPLNESVNTLINQLIDTGTMVNTAGGFLGRGAKIRGGVYTFSPLEWKRVDSTGDDLRKNIFPLPVREPSSVLFQLLGLLIDYTNRISGATEMLSGQNPGQNTAATTTEHMVEQGMKVYAAIFKRIWRSLKHEFKKLYLLNAIHLPSRKGYPGGEAMREDYLGDPNRVVPAADPNIVSDTIRFGQARLLAERATMVPGYDKDKVELNLLRAAQIDGYENYYVGAAKSPPGEDVKITVEKLKLQAKELEMKAKMQAQQAEMEKSAMEFAIQIQEQHELNEATISSLQAKATALLADAANEDTGHQIAAINSQIALAKMNDEKLKQRLETLLAGVRLEHEMHHDEAMVEIERIKANKAKSS
jgi:chaperonin GroES